jgi:hypothetical protein
MLPIFSMQSRKNALVSRAFLLSLAPIRRKEPTVEPTAVNPLVQLIPLLLWSVMFGVVAHLLAKEKGRNVVRWTVLGVVPLVNVICLPFFVGAANLRLEGKIDALLARREG